VLQQLRGSPSLVLVVYQHLRDDVLAFRTHVWNLLCEPLRLDWLEVNFHVSRMLSEILHDLLIGSSNDVMNFVDLVHFIISWKQWTKRQYLVHDTADAPNVHFVTVIAVSEKALGRPVPPRTDVLCQWLILVETPATPKVCQLDRLASK